VKSENLAVAFLDIEGFSARTAAQSREENQRMVERFESSVRPVLRAFGGRVVKTIGDALLVTFRSPTDALHAAMAAQDRLAETCTRLPEPERFRIRVAVNAGEVRLERGDVFGEAVNVASRLESIAEGGEILFSEAVHLVMNRSEVPFAEVGLREFKGSAEPVRVYRIPRVAEVGTYRVQGSGTVPRPSEERHPLDPPSLPFGGFALERIRIRLPDAAAAATGRSDEGVASVAGRSLRHSHAEASAAASRRWSEGGFGPFLAAPAYGATLLRALARGATSAPMRSAAERSFEATRATADSTFTRFRARFRESPAFRRNALVGAAIVLALLAWMLWPRRARVQDAPRRWIFQEVFGSGPAATPSTDPRRVA
jgi:class 3 adenylate cyclase